MAGNESSGACTRRWVKQNRATCVDNSYSTDHKNRITAPPVRIRFSADNTPASKLLPFVKHWLWSLSALKDIRTQRRRRRRRRLVRSCWCLWSFSSRSSEARTAIIFRCLEDGCVHVKYFAGRFSMRQWEVKTRACRVWMHRIAVGSKRLLYLGQSFSPCTQSAYQSALLMEFFFLIIFLMRSNEVLPSHSDIELDYVLLLETWPITGLSTTAQYIAINWIIHHCPIYSHWLDYPSLPNI